MATINTNFAALKAQQNLNNTGAKLSTSIERLSSGLRINSAKDDAAGQAIGNRMATNLRANSAITRGINDGVSLIQTAEGGLDSINSILQRSRELAVQAANGTLSDSDRAFINDEYQALRAEIDRIAKGTEAFGKYPLAPTQPPPQPAQLGNTEHIVAKLSPASSVFTSGIVPVAYIPTGATNIRIEIDSFSMDDDMQLFTRDGKHLVGTPIIGSDNSPTDNVWSARGISDTASANANLLSEANGFLVDADYDASFFEDATDQYDVAQPPVSLTYSGMTITYSGDRDRAFDPDDSSFNDGQLGGVASSEMREVITIDQTTEELMLLVVGQGAFSAFATWDEMPVELVESAPIPPPVGTATKVVTSAGYGEALDSMTIQPTPSDHISLGLMDVELDPIEKAREAIEKLQSALNQVDDYRAQYGALTNRFESIIDNLANQSVNTAAARSRIMDADYAQEASKLVKAQILQQAGSSMLAQANQAPQGLVTLLNQAD
ncbi:flagellin N-terminal helical domain-containing protein [Halomonas sp. C22]|uniref:flagellin N-terminal helical domain-containing protein n=1 Tax=Halomonas sp. C22 TaxID=2580567 RepID=UPI0011A79DD8|nr:flagellin [Halomonas sp. C22]